MRHKNVKVVQNEGMPIYRDPYDKGQLIVQFEVSLYLSLDVKYWLFRWPSHNCDFLSGGIPTETLASRAPHASTGKAASSQEQSHAY